jgi:hypothetical protein
MANNPLSIVKGRFVEVNNIKDVFEDRTGLWRVKPNSLLLLFPEGGDRYISTAFNRNHKKRLSVEHPS